VYCAKKIITYYIAAAFSLIYVYQAMFGIVAPQYHRGLFVGFTLILAFLLRPLKKKFLLLDLLFIILSFFGIGYFMIRYPQYCLKIGLPINNLDVIMGTITILLLLEITRRYTGWILTIMGLSCLFYLSFGQYFPQVIRHSGFSYNTIVARLYTGLEGIFGATTYAFAQYVFLLIVFGSFLEKSGIVNFFMEFAKSLVGSSRGGVAKISVISSALIGSVTGSVTSNVAITGAITIPSMKKAGYKPYEAGGIEVAASYGGSILPPIMGATAFIMASMINISYITIIKYAAIPAIFYYVGVFYSIHFSACKAGTRIKILSKKDCPKLKENLKKGWYFVPFLVLVLFLSLGYSIPRVTIIAIFSVIVVSFIMKENRMSFRKIIDALAKGAISSINVLSVLGVVGVISLTMFLPGMGLKISNMIIQFSGNLLFPTICIVFILAYILGMGLPIIPAYIILVVVAAPALIKLGAPILGAHLLVLWWAQSSTITPPVCLAVFVASAISGSEVWPTGVEAIKKASMNYILPFLFIYDSLFLLNGSLIKIILRLVIIIIAIIAFQGGLEGYFLKDSKIIDRILLLVGGTLLFIPYFSLNIIGLSFVFLVFLLQRSKKNVILVDLKKNSPVN